MEIAKQFHFDAAHYLTKYKGKCENLHGHTYKLQVFAKGKLNDEDMVIDFADIKKTVKERVLSKLDHSNLNDIFKNPTTELIAIWIFDNLKDKIPVSKVKLWETRDSFVVYEGKK